MGVESLKPVILRSYVVTGFLAVLIGAGAGWFCAKGFLFGGVWSATNMWALKFLAVEYFKTEKDKKGFIRLIAAFNIKIVLLYGVGTLLLVTVPMSILAGLAGFQVPFFLLGAEVYSLQKKEKKPPSRNSIIKNKETGTGVI